MDITVPLKWPVICTKMTPISLRDNVPGSKLLSYNECFSMITKLEIYLVNFEVTITFLVV